VGGSGVGVGGSGVGDGGTGVAVGGSGVGGGGVSAGDPQATNKLTTNIKATIKLILRFINPSFLRFHI
jgi:hypothetical protein